MHDTDSLWLQNGQLNTVGTPARFFRAGAFFDLRFPILTNCFASKQTRKTKLLDGRQVWRAEKSDFQSEICKRLETQFANLSRSFSSPSRSSPLSHRVPRLICIKILFIIHRLFNVSIQSYTFCFAEIDARALFLFGGQTVTATTLFCVQH